MNEVGQQTYNGPDDVGLDDIVARIWSGRYWVFASVSVFAVCGILAGIWMTPVYRGTAVLVDGTPSGAMGGLTSAFGQLGGLASLAGINLPSSASQVEESIAVLRSREFTERFIVDRNLMPKLFADRWDAPSGKFTGDSADWPTLVDAFEYFDNIRSISRDRLTGLISLSIEWRDPVEAAEWANSLVARLNEEMRQRSITSTTASIGFLEKELATTSAVETRQAINRLIEAQINQRMLANVTLEYAFRVVDRAMPADPRKPVKPRKLSILLASILLGMILGSAGVLAKGGLSRKRTTT
jgi:uncharacterized protein involved in exopolysaccharide biosynthesis